MRAALAGFALAAAISAVAVHLAVVNAIPTFIMSRAFSGLEAGGVGWNQWTAAPRITPLTQSVVRSSPDLAYAVCLIDLSGGPVRLSVPTWPRYGSLSVFDHTTTNVHITPLDGDGASVSVLVVTDDQPAPEGWTGPVVHLPGPKGLALIRRLAPSDDLNQAATALVQHSECSTATGAT